MKVNIKEITVVVNDRELTLSYEEALALYRALDAAFGNKATATIYPGTITIPQTIPTVPWASPIGNGIISTYITGDLSKGSVVQLPTGVQVNEEIFSKGESR